MVSQTKLKNALVLLSGGQDSTTCLFWAKSIFKEVEALSFDYGQRHRIELTAAKKVADYAKVKHQILNINTFTQIGQNALLDPAISIFQNLGELPNTFVPGRNLIFLTYAAALAYTKNISDLVVGACETDYSGYPDCRRNTIDSLEKTLSLGMDGFFTIHTPLMHLTKKETIDLAVTLNCVNALALTHTCYEGQVPPCEKCPACKLRAKGFADAGVKDPLKS